MIESIQDTVTISQGVEMPRLGFGTYKAAEGDEVAGSVRTALEIGYRSVDTASFYGNEVGVGAGIRDSGVPREAVFIATKVWNTEQGFSETQEALERSLARLDVDYVDLYLVHWPIPSLMLETWRAMERCLVQGLARAIGVCNFLPHHLDALLSRADVAPAVDQFEFHPRLQQPEVVSFCVRNSIAVEAWAPIMRGRVNDVAEIQGIASRHDKTPAQVT
ncbi:MAG: aldo/keto reductase, partial [Coriobacteriia bacterium]|nr:aldo/keto reductase [Coriobacteriia bacterium]